MRWIWHLPSWLKKHSLALGNTVVSRPIFRFEPLQNQLVSHGGKPLVTAMNHRASGSDSVDETLQTISARRNLTPTEGTADTELQCSLHMWKWLSLYNQGHGSFLSQQSQSRCSGIGPHTLCMSSKLGSKQSTGNGDSSQESQGNIPLASGFLQGFIKDAGISSSLILKPSGFSPLVCYQGLNAKAKIYWALTMSQALGWALYCHKLI